MRKLFRIKEIQFLALDDVCDGSADFLSFLNELFSLQFRGDQTVDLDIQMKLQYPVCASVEIIKTASESLVTDVPPLLVEQAELKIKFMYVLELSGIKKSKDKMEYGIFSKPTYEIREYYSGEDEWLANEENNLCVKKNPSSANVHKQMLKYSLIRHFQSKATKEQIISHYQQCCFNTVGTVHFVNLVFLFSSAGILLIQVIWCENNFNQNRKMLKNQGKTMQAASQ